MRKAQRNHRELNAQEVKEWFATHGATLVVAPESGIYFGKERYISDNESVFFSGDGREQLIAEVSYEEGCPTCGGAYVKRWVLWTEQPNKEPT